MKFVWPENNYKKIPMSTLRTNITCDIYQLAGFHKGEVDSTWNRDRYKKATRTDTKYSIKPYGKPMWDDEGYVDDWGALWQSH